MLAALPVAILVASPQRVALSAAIAAGYVLAAALTVRDRHVHRAVIAFACVVAAWMALSWLRSRFLLHLTAEQLAYGTGKTAYFVLIVLPLAAAVAVMIERVEDIKPVVFVQIAIAFVVATLTVTMPGNHFLGADRYSWQGNLIGLGTAVAVQRWPVQRFAASVALGLLGVAGVMIASSRQAVVAMVVALALTAVYWAASRCINGRDLRHAIADRYVMLPVVLIVLSLGFIAATYAGIGTGWGGSSCNCVTDRLVSLETGAGDRDRLLAQGVRLFIQHPLLGAGLGSFAGRVPDSLHPGQLYQYPHNVPLETAAETGIVGFALLFVPLLAGWWLLFWNGVKQASAPIAGLLALLAVFFTVANISGDIPSERGMWIFGVVAFKFGVDQLRKQTSTSRTLASAA